MENDTLVHFGNNDRRSFGAAFQKYYPALCVFAERMVGQENAEDVIEDLFAGLWDKDRDFQSEGHLKAFLYHSAKNACLNFIKSDLRANQRNTLYAKNQSEIEDSYLTEVTRTELIRSLHLAIAELPPQCSKIISMGYIDGLDNAAIAEKLGLSIQTVKNQKVKGLEMLRKRLPGDKYLLLFLLLHHWQ